MEAGDLRLLHTAVLHKKLPGQPWVQIACATGRDLAIGEWHELTVRGRGNVLTVLTGGHQVLLESPCRASEDAPSPEGLQRDVSRPGNPRFPSGGSVAVCRSTDEGQTWSPAQIILDTPLDDRDPSVWQCDDGTIYVSSVSVDWANFKAPYDQWCYSYLARSTDNGHSWNQPEELRIGDQRDYTAWTEPRRLKDGHWLWPVYRNHNSDLTAAVLRSTDGGHSWGPPHLLDETSKSTDEPDLCQFPDGTLFCAMRPGPERHMWQSWSRDNGHTWTKPAPLPFLGHCANLLHTRSGVTLLAHRDPGTTIHWSVDQAKTWAGAAMIDTCGGAYTQMVELADGRILVVYYTEGARSQIRAQWLRADQSGLRCAPNPSTP